MRDQAAVRDFLSGISVPRRAEEAKILSALFEETTGWQPKLWRGNILGYGTYDYTYKSGRSGSYLATGFAPRTARLSVYIMPGYADFSDILTGLGKHKIGKSCLYINKLEDVDLSVLKTLIRAGLEDLAARWPIHPT